MLRTLLFLTLFSSLGIYAQGFERLLDLSVDESWRDIRIHKIEINPGSQKLVLCTDEQYNALDENNNINR